MGDGQIAYLVEELEQINIICLLSKVLLEQKVDGSFEHKRVVDGDVGHTLLLEHNIASDASSVTRDSTTSLPFYTSRAGLGE